MIFCILRLGETCSHVDAMLYKIEKAIRSGIAEQASTDLPCIWKRNFVTDMTAGPLNNMFYTGEAKEKLLSANTSSKVVNPTFAQK